MEAEDNLLINISTTFVNNILNEKSFHTLQKGPSVNTAAGSEFLPSLPLLESDDDEDLKFCLRQHNMLQSANLLYTSKMPSKTTVSKNPPQNKLPSEGRRKAHRQGTPEIPEKYLISELSIPNELDGVSFENSLHMSKASFLKLFKHVDYFLKLSNQSNDMMNVPPLKVFFLALWKLITDQHYEEITLSFHMPLYCCQLVIRKFWHIMSENYESFIRWPNSHRAQQNAIRDFQNIAELKSFDKLFGVIVIKRLDVFLEGSDEEVSVIIQLICNAQRKVIDCFVELAKEYSFESSPIGQTLDINSQTIPTGCYIIGDGSFPLRHFLIRPFEIECFNQEIIFNRMILPAINFGRSVIELMEQHFHSLYALEAKDISEVRKVLETISALHNLCIDHHENYMDKDISTSFKAGQGVTRQHSSVSLNKGNETNRLGQETRMKLMEHILKYTSNSKCNVSIA